MHQRQKCSGQKQRGQCIHFKLMANTVRVEVLQAHALTHPCVENDAMQRTATQSLNQIRDGIVIGELNLLLNLDPEVIQGFTRLATDADDLLSAVTQLPALLEADTAICASHQVGVHGHPSAIDFSDSSAIEIMSDITHFLNDEPTRYNRSMMLPDHAVRGLHCSFPVSIPSWAGHSSHHLGPYPQRSSRFGSVVVNATFMHGI